MIKERHGLFSLAARLPGRGRLPGGLIYLSFDFDTAFRAEGLKSEASGWVWGFRFGRL